MSRSHDACGAKTRIRLPRALPERAVQRVICKGCQQPYRVDERVGPGPARADVERSLPRPVETPTAEPTAAPDSGLLAGAETRTETTTEDEAPAIEPTAGPAPAAADSAAAAAPEPAAERRRTLPRLPLPKLPSAPRGRLWRWGSIPLAAAAVIGGMLLIQGEERAPVPAPAVEVTASPAEEARFIEEPGFSLALPAGWERQNPPKGAAFAASAEDGLADATLWIERDRKLSFEQFEQRSLAQLSELADNARVVDRVEGPTIESTIVELRADAPLSDGVSVPYRVTLRAAGPYFLYLSTVIQPGAPAKLNGDAELLHGSLRPDVKVEGIDSGGGA